MTIIHIAGSLKIYVKIIIQNFEISNKYSLIVGNLNNNFDR